MTRPLALTVAAAGLLSCQVVAVPQQLVLHTAVLPSLVAAVALICTVCPTLVKVAEAGAIVTLEIVSLLLTVMVEVLLT